MNNEFRKKLIQFLSLLTILFLIVLLAFNINQKENEQEKEKTEFSLEEADSLLKFTVGSFGLPSELLVKRKNKKDPNIDSSYTLKIPYDLSVPEILAELNHHFNNSNIKVSSTEKKISGSTELTLISPGYKIFVDINYSKEVTRTKGNAAFIITGINELDEKPDSLLLSLPEIYTLLIIPSDLNVTLADRIKENKKVFALLISDETEDLTYKFSSSYSEHRTNISVRNIAGDFGRASFLVIDRNSSFVDSEIFPKMVAEFEKRDMKMVYLDDLEFLSGEDDNLTVRLGSYLKDLNTNSGVMIMISAEDYLTVLPDIKRFRKIGYNFIRADELIN